MALASAVLFWHGTVSADAVQANFDPGRDYHSLANPRALKVEHLDLALDVNFEAHRLSGTVDLRVRRLDPAARELLLDTRDLVIRQVWLVNGPDALVPTGFRLGDRDPILGRALHVEVPVDAETSVVRISYQTDPSAAALQWLTPAQTAGKKHPFLFSQSQAIQARSWIPLQDTPQVRVTYRATIHTPRELRAVMGAASEPTPTSEGRYEFEMTRAIPSYLMALAVGDLEFRRIGPRTGVYAEPVVADAAAKEFADTESMLETGERLFGPYRWDRYDLLILPPSFPFGGMENPRLSFITPTVIAGDRSLVSLIAHELAHSWSGNLVTNATWRDFWLNEGFTVFLERRIMEAVYGKNRRDMEDVLGLQGLQEELASLQPRDQLLANDLRGRDPDEGVTEVAYEKGYLFLEYLQSRVGRERFESFLREYFDSHAFQSVTTEDFVAYLQAHLLNTAPDAISAAALDTWLYQPGLPADAVLPQSDVFGKVDAQKQAWLAGARAAADLDTAAWSTHEWLHFIDNLPPQLSAAQMNELDAAFHLTEAGNSEIEHSWLRVAIRNHYQPALPRLENYLTTIGRRKLIRPLYEDLMKTDWGTAEARRIYALARPGYHPLAVATLDAIVLPPRSATARPAP